MSGYRSRKEALEYVRYLKDLKKTSPKGHCEFCIVANDKTRATKDGQFFVVTPNIFPYSMWDEMKVIDHLLLLPKEHTVTLSGMPKEAAVEFVDLMSGYENDGYSVYARAANNPIKTVAHQHTHLIKTDGHRKKLLLHIRKPRIRVSI